MSVDRRKHEFELLSRKYGPSEHAPNLDWILFKQFPLPSGWNAQAAELLVLIPPGYPTTPPDNFYVRNGLRLADGRIPANYSENQNVLGDPWAVFSFHAQGWNPSPSSTDGDSMLSFMIAVERRFEERS